MKTGMKTDPCYRRQKCRLGTLVSGQIKFTLILAGMSNDSGVYGHFQCFCWLYLRNFYRQGQHHYTAALYWSQNRRHWMTLNFILNSVFMPVCWAWEIVAFEDNWVQINKVRSMLSAMQMLSTDCSFWNYQVYADIHRVLWKVVKQQWDHVLTQCYTLM